MPQRERQVNRRGGYWKQILAGRAALVNICFQINTETGRGDGIRIPNTENKDTGYMLEEGLWNVLGCEHYSNNFSFAFIGS
jgi:hypothetical protein